jgi:hypothetical protein
MEELAIGGGGGHTMITGTLRRELRRREPKDQSPNCSIMWSKRPLASGSAIKKGGGFALHLSCWVSRRQEAVSTPKINDLGFLYLGSLGCSSFYGYPV